MLTLYDYYRSSACYRVRIALNLKKLHFDTIPIHLLNNNGEQFSAEYASLNPQCLVPTIIHDHHILTQSLAIIEYLDETYDSFPLLPKNTYQKALVRSFALSIAADIHPLNNLRVLNYLTKTLAITEEQKSHWYHHWLAIGLSALEKRLSATTHHFDFCFGNTPTLADICLVPQLYNARRFSCDLSQYPTLVKIDLHCQQLVEFVNAAPEKSTAEEGAR